MKKNIISSEDRIVFLPDCHVPFNIELEPVWRFIEDFKPTVVILGGDTHDFGSVSSWLADQSRALDGGIIKENYNQLEKVVFEPLRKAAPKAKKVYQVGNHDARINTLIRVEPNFRGYADLEENIPKDFELFQENIPYKAGPNLIFIHGIYVNLYHARKTVESYHVSVIYGHIHTFQAHTLVSPIDSTRFYMGQSIGCLSTLNPEFMKNKPNAWMNGLAYVYVNPDGTFHHVPVVIVNNKFYANGKFYK